MELLQVSENEKDKVREHYNMTEPKIKVDLQLIKEWLSKEPHLPQDISDTFIEHMLLRNKFRVEQTKKKVDNYFTMRGKHQDIFQGLEKIRPSQISTAFFPLPNLTANQERITIIKIINPDPGAYNPLLSVQLPLVMGEFTLRHDYAIGDRYVFDNAGFSMTHLLQINIALISKLISVFQDGYSSRILGLEMINVPPFAAQILRIFKSVMKPKIYDRIRIHPNLDSLHKAVPKHYLPNDYGGNQGNIQDLLAKWDKVVESNEQFLVDNLKKVSNEELRIGAVKNNPEFGLEGSFKKLNID